MTKADVILQKLAGLGSVMDKLPKSLRRGIMGAIAAGSLSVGAKAAEGGKWIDVNTPTLARRAAEMTGGDVFKGTMNWKAPHSGKQQIKLRLATGSEPDSLMNTSSSFKETITANPNNTTTTRRISSFRN